MLVPVGEPPRVIEIPDTLEGLQQAVGGRADRFAHFPLTRDGKRSGDLWCADDGMDVLPLNRLVKLPLHADHLAISYTFEIWGPIVITAGDETTGETYSLTETEAARCIALARRWPIIESAAEGGPQ